MSFKKHTVQLVKQLKTFRVTSAIEADAIESYLCSLDCPRSLSVWMLFKYGEHRQLVDLAFDPLQFNTADDTRNAYLATKFLSKFTGLKTGIDVKKVAFEKFSEFERLCGETNRNFRNLALHPLFKGEVVYLHNAVVRKISRILGQIDYKGFFLDANWGPGASTLIKRRDASSSNKFQNETGITRDLYSLLPTGTFELLYPHWGQHLDAVGFPHFEVGNKVVTVPKDASTDRVIAIEPGINSWFQKSIGRMIDKRLLWVGVDLKDQTINQKLSRQGSISGELATVDLRSASDSIAVNVVRELLPPDWFSMMDSCRSHFGSLNGEVLRWNKFSSMGNGFTFPLQSLIFYAIAKCCAEYQSTDLPVSVFGDDVILPTSSFSLFSRMLSFYGFQINPKKTFYSSWFRESCGAHWYRGLDLKPIYLKDRISSVSAVFRLANAVRRLAHRDMNFMACNARYRATFELLVRSVPSRFRLRIDNSLGDGGFISNFDESSPSRARNYIEGYICAHLVETGVYRQDDKLGYLLTELWRLSSRTYQHHDQIYDDGSLSGVIPAELEAIDISSRAISIAGRNKVYTGRNTLRIVKSLVQQWYNLGPWLG